MDRSRSRTRSVEHPYNLPAPIFPADNAQAPPTGVSRHLVWNGTSTLRQLRRVLILVNLQEVRHVMEELCHSDAMPATRIFTLPDLEDAEEGLFTYARLLQPSQLKTIHSEILLSGISQYIFHAWGVQVDPDEVDLRWSDATGDTFALLNHQSVNRLLTEH